MKYLSLFTFILMAPVFCYAQMLEELPQEEKSYGDGKMFRQTQNALMKYEIIQEKSEYWGNRLEKMLLGDYADKVLIIAPLVTGKLQFSALDLNFYIDAREEKSGVKYTYNF